MPNFDIPSVLIQGEVYLPTHIMQFRGWTTTKNVTQQKKVKPQQVGIPHCTCALLSAVLTTHNTASSMYAILTLAIMPISSACHSGGS